MFFKLPLKFIIFQKNLKERYKIVLKNFIHEIKQNMAVKASKEFKAIAARTNNKNNIKNYKTKKKAFVLLFFYASLSSIFAEFLHSKVRHTHT